MNDGLYCPLVSIIIPVYNCERYINKCIQSVINQTYSNLEIIIIDDGSTDDSGKICDYFAKRDSRIRLIHQRNGGPGIARNTGLSHVSGEYIAFIDADDYVSTEYIHKMVLLAFEYQSDIVEVCSIWMLPLKNEFHSSNLPIQQFYGSQELVADYFSSNRKLQNSLWGRLFRWNVIRDIRFSNKSIAEDTEYSLKAFINCKKLVKSNEVLYVYRAYPESVTRRTLSAKHFDVVDISVNEMLLCECFNVKIVDWQSLIDKLATSWKGLLSKVAEKHYENKFALEIKNMQGQLATVSQIAKRHDAILNTDIYFIISNFPKWCRYYRKRNFIKILLKKAKMMLVGTVVAIKVRFNYEYKFSKK